MEIRSLCLFLFTFLILNTVRAQENISGYQHIRISDEIELIKISSDAYIHVTTAEMQGFGVVSSNGLIYTNGNESILFDTPPDDHLTETLVRYMKDRMNLEIVAFVPNHWHDDCMGGLNFLKKISVKSYASEKTVEMAGAHNLPVPDHSFRDSLELNLGGKKVICWYPGAAHSMDNIVVWIPSEKILFAGCLCKSLESVNLGNIADGDAIQYPVTISKIISRFSNAEIVIPGHGKFGGFNLLTHTKALATAPTR